MSKFEKVKTYYEKGFWTENMVRNAVIKKWITKSDYWLITNENY